MSGNNKNNMETTKDVAGGPKQVDQSTNLLGEYLSTSTYLLKNIKSHQLKPAECVPILEHLQNDLTTTVTALRESLTEKHMPSQQTEYAKTYFDQVNTVVERIPQFVLILKKYPKGNSDLDEFTGKILDQLIQLNAGLSGIGNDAGNEKLTNKM